MTDPTVQLRPVTREDLGIFHVFLTEPDVSGHNWKGFRDPNVAVRRFEADGYLAPDNGRLIVDVDGVGAGFLSWFAVGIGEAKYWNIGIALLSEHRGHGIGTVAQDMLCEYLFRHTPVQRIEAGTQPENIAEQKALLKAGFTHEGVLRCAEFRAGAWRDVWVYGRLRSDPPVHPENTDESDRPPVA